MNSIFTAVTVVVQTGVLHAVQVIDGVKISEPGMLVLLGTVLFGIGTFGRRKLPQ